MVNLCGIHDREGENFSPSGTWLLDTIALSENPNPKTYSENFSWIIRANYGYGSTGTIPLNPTDQEIFISRLINYAKTSKNGTRFIIGNEPNLSREWPDGKPIYPQQYADFYRRCRRALHDSMGEKCEVLIAASGPWNNELKYQGNSNGDWIKNFSDTISACQGELDGFSIHSYCHNYDVNLVWSETMMNFPFENRHYDFRTYRDYTVAIPQEYAHLPIYLTEANGGPNWQAVGLMPAMAREINSYNEAVVNRKIKCLIFYRYPHYDDYYIQGKSAVEQEYKETVNLNFQTFMPVAATPTPAPVDPYPGAIKALVKATLLNVRDKAGTVGSNIVGTRKEGDKISILEEKNVDDKIWYRIGENEWVIAEWTNRQPTLPTLTPKTDWERARAFTAGWEGGFQDLDWDAGNWTGCKVGQGIKKGTNFGISACSYPGRDIAGLTRADADKIYFEDYWQKSGADKLPWPLNLIHFDTAINFGVEVAKYYLEKSGGDPLLYIAMRLRGYRKSAAWPNAGNAWVDRTADLLAEASHRE